MSDAPDPRLSLLASDAFALVLRALERAETLRAQGLPVGEARLKALTAAMAELDRYQVLPVSFASRQTPSGDGIATLSRVIDEAVIARRVAVATPDGDSWRCPEPGCVNVFWTYSQLRRHREDLHPATVLHGGL